MNFIKVLSSILICAVVGSASFAFADDVTFNYQGRVKVHGQPYNGTGQFKFSIVTTSGTSTLWTNDSTADVPVASIGIPVSDGIFSVNVGGAELGMAPINGMIFNQKSPPKLRVWFDGGQGFQQLNPDHVLSDLTLNTVQTGLDDFTVFVNDETGNDGNNGLSADEAKKTIQAAIDSLPDRIRCNVTVDIAPGVYREFVRVYGMSVDPVKTFKIIGDKTWTHTSTGNPNVRITGVDQDGKAKKRNTGLRIDNSSNITVEGLFCDQVLENGFDFRNGHYKLQRCKAAQAYTGISASPQAYIEIQNCIANDNSAFGFVITRSSDAKMTNFVAKFNEQNGIFCHQSSYLQFFTFGDVSNNGQAGMNFGGYASASCWTPGTFHVKDNGTYGITAGWFASFSANGLVQFSGNPSGNTLAFNNGMFF